MSVECRCSIPVVLLEICVWQSDFCVSYHSVPAYCNIDKGFVLIKAKTTFLICILPTTTALNVFILSTVQICG